MPSPRRWGEALLIGRVLEGGGAAEAGLIPGDLISAIDGARVAELGFEGAVNRIRGPEASVVVLTVATGNAPSRDVAVPRRRIRR